MISLRRILDELHRDLTQIDGAAWVAERRDTRTAVQVAVDIDRLVTGTAPVTDVVDLPVARMDKRPVLDPLNVQNRAGGACLVPGSASPLWRHRTCPVDRADGLVGAGHAVTLFASGDSHTHARLCSVYAEAPSTRLGDADPLRSGRWVLT